MNKISAVSTAVTKLVTKSVSNSFNTVTDAIDYIVNEAEVIKQFRKAPDETHVELRSLIKQLCIDMAYIDHIFDDIPVIHNWTYHEKENSIEGQIYNNKNIKSGKLIGVDILDIDFNDGVVRSEEGVFNLGAEIGFITKRRKRDRIKEKRRKINEKIDKNVENVMQKLIDRRIEEKEKTNAEFGICLFIGIVFFCAVKYFWG